MIAAVVGSGERLPNQVVLLAIFNVCFVLPLLGSSAPAWSPASGRAVGSSGCGRSVDRCLATLVPGLVLLVGLAVLAIGVVRPASADKTSTRLSRAFGRGGSDMVRHPSGAFAARSSFEQRTGGTHHMEFDKFAIGFDHRDRERLHALWDGILDDEHLVGRPARQGVRGRPGRPGTGCRRSRPRPGRARRSPRSSSSSCAARPCSARRTRSWPTPLAIVAAGAKVEFVDCNRDDLCMSFDDLERKVHEHKPAAVILVHIGGHIAFDIDRIAELCRAEGIVLIEDCAHSHGASWNGRKPGHVRRRRHLVVRADEDDLDRRGRPARLDATPT